MFYPGLVSISFRSLTPAEVLNTCKIAEIHYVEWGTDSHVKTPDAASDVFCAGKECGILPCSCGSYYKLGLGTRQDLATVLQIARSLKTNIVRIWGGNKGSTLLSKADLDRLAKEAYDAAEMADAQGIDLCLECHPNTITDSYESELSFLRLVDHPRLKTYWQPNQFESLSYNLEAAEALAPYTKMIHVFAWSATERFPLQQHLAEWEQYLTCFNRTGATYGTLLEFMPDDSPSTLPREADTLRALLSRFQ